MWYEGRSFMFDEVQKLIAAIVELGSGVTCGST